MTSLVTKPLLLDSTGKEIVGGIERQNILLTRLISASAEETPIATLNEIREIVARGEAPLVFNIGDQINIKWNDGTNDYILPFDITHFGDVELQDGEIVPGMYIQSHYALTGIQFDQNEGFYVVPAAGMQAGTYCFTIGNSWGSNVVAGKIYSFTLTEDYTEGDILQLGTATSETSGLPDQNPANWRVRTYKKSGNIVAGKVETPTEILTLTEETEETGTSLGTLSSSTKYGTSGLNNMQRSAYGYNRWSQSAIRQWMNSAAAADAWWNPQNPYDRRPNELKNTRGMMAGFDEAFLNILGKVKVGTALNTLSDSDISASENTYDTFFLASLEQEYCSPQLAGVEGEYWEYWKRRTGLASPSNATNTARIRYAYNAKSSAQSCRLRSADRGDAYDTWGVNASGFVYTYSATNARRAVPACVIC